MKKKLQLGMDPSTASNRLVKDLLFRYVQKDQPNCCHCGEPMARNNFSVEHKIPWLNSTEPLKLFFDLDNVAFAHIRCNCAKARKFNKIYPDLKTLRREKSRVRYRAQTEHILAMKRARYWKDNVSVTQRESALLTREMLATTPAGGTNNTPIT